MKSKTVIAAADADVEAFGRIMNVPDIERGPGGNITPAATIKHRENLRLALTPILTTPAGLDRFIRNWLTNHSLRRRQLLAGAGITLNAVHRDEVGAIACALAYCAAERLQISPLPVPPKPTMCETECHQYLGEILGLIIRDEDNWQAIQWINKMCNVTAADVRVARHRGKRIRTRRDGGQSRYNLPDIIREFPAKAQALVKKNS